MIKLFYLCCLLMAAVRGQNRTLPDGFLLGFATSSYQIEGGWNEDGRSKSTWDQFISTHPGLIADGSNGEIACDSYHKYKDDVQMLKDLGAQFYRFALSWSRIMPDGITTAPNQKGIDYYNNLIDELLANGIQPMVTLLHRDEPQRLMDLGGWTNPVVGDYFVDYAKVAFENFGDRVKWWTTFNEPFEVAKTDYAGTAGPPSLNMTGIAEYLMAHTLLQTHARVYHLYDEKFRPSQKGKIGIVLAGGWNEPLSNSTADLEAADRANQFQVGILSHPIFSVSGDYPAVVRAAVDANSLQEGWGTSRLPKFTPDLVQYIKGTSDFFGMNMYSANLITPAIPPEGPSPSFQRDMAVKMSQDPSWPPEAFDFMRVVPWSLRKFLNWVRTEYNNVPVFITENGFADLGELEDDGRIDMHNGYMQEMLNAIYEDGCNVLGYAAWSLMDNFEWTGGYIYKFGVYSVDFNDPERPRTPKKSAQYFKDVLKTRTLPEIPTNSSRGKGTGAH